MKKLLILLLVFVLALSLFGCGASNTESDMVSDSSVSSENSTEASPITEEDAIEIASNYWGVKSGDKDETTGFPFLIMPVDSSNDNIKIALKWFVNNENYSTVDMVEIDPFTGEIVTDDTQE